MWKLMPWVWKSYHTQTKVTTQMYFQKLIFLITGYVCPAGETSALARCTRVQFRSGGLAPKKVSGYTQKTPIWKFSLPNCWRHNSFVVNMSVMGFSSDNRCQWSRIASCEKMSLWAPNCQGTDGDRENHLLPLHCLEESHQFYVRPNIFVSIQLVLSDIMEYGLPKVLK